MSTLNELTKMQQKLPELRHVVITESSNWIDSWDTSSVHFLIITDTMNGMKKRDSTIRH